MVKKISCMFLAVLICLLSCITVSASAIENSSSQNGIVYTAMATPRSGGPETTKTRPPVPNGFYTQPYATLTQNAVLDVTFAVIESITCAIVMTPFGGGTALFTGALVAGLQALGGGSLPANAIEYIYEAKDPVGDFQVPYVYWHLIKYTINTVEGDVVVYTNYYEYAVMPRGITDSYK